MPNRFRVAAACGVALLALSACGSEPEPAITAPDIDAATQQVIDEMPPLLQALAGPEEIQSDALKICTAINEVEIGQPINEALEILSRPVVTEGIDAGSLEDGDFNNNTYAQYEGPYSISIALAFCPKAAVDRNII